MNESLPDQLEDRHRLDLGAESRNDDRSIFEVELQGAAGFLGRQRPGADDQ